MATKAHCKASKSNPNPRGGCLCSPNQKIVGCAAPFLVFTHSELYDVRQPYPVLSHACLMKCLDKLGPLLPQEPDDEPPAQPPQPAAQLTIDEVLEFVAAAVKGAQLAEAA